MNMNGRGPMHRDFSRMGRRMRRSLGWLPLGGLFLLPGLFLGGWIALTVVISILALVGTIIGGVFAGLAAVASRLFAGSGVALGILLGYLLFRHFRKRKAQEEDTDESLGTVDDVQVETRVEETPEPVEPVEQHYRYMG